MLNFIKKEIVFVISFLLAAVSCFFVAPSAAYLFYIDFNVLLLLFSFMAVVAGLRESGVFDAFAILLCKLASSVRSICVMLIFLCFGFSMLITNDVALLTFVPFTILILSKLNQQKYLALVVVLQTVAANLGSMLTPMGNPQNLFLFSMMNISAIKFCLILLPYVLLSGVLLFLSSLIIPKTKIEKISFTNSTEKNLENEKNFDSENQREKKSKNLQIIIYSTLFICCILSVLKIIPVWVLAILVAGVIAIVQFKNLLKVDYILILTFVCFFIFSGNIQNIQIVKNALQSIVGGNEFFTGFVASQVISNVPATLLLFPFAKNLNELLLGVDIGGLGTLVASLASLISYKIYSNASKSDSKKFIKLFTLINLIFIIILFLQKVLISKICS